MGRRFGGVAGILSVLFTLAGGCGGAPPERIGGVVLGSEVEAPGPAATTYTATPMAEPVVGPSDRVAAVERGLAAAWQSEHVALAGDGRLATLASWVIERLGEGATLPPNEVVRFFAHHLGLPEQTPHLLMLGAADPATLESGVHDSVVEYLRRQRYDAYGAAVVVRQGLTLVVVCLSVRPYELRPVPRHLGSHEAIAVRGRLGSAYGQPVFVVTHPDGHSERLPAGRGPDFEVSVPTSADGAHEVELLADGPTGATVLADFPVYVGVDVPRSVRLDAHRPTEGAASADGVRDELFRLLSEERQRAGLAPLVVHDGLARVALAHSTDMVEHDFVGHRSPTTGEPVDRLAAAGLSSGLVLENIGRGYSARDVHDGLMRSPAHRANILNPDVTHVGIGVVVEMDGSRRAYLATEVFVRMAQAIDVQRAPSDLLARINQARAARGAARLESDPNLEQAASQGARDYFAERTLDQQEVVDRASASMRRFAIAYRRIGGVMAVVTTLDEAARLEPTFDPGLRYIGIGIAQGERPDQPPNSIAVVLLFAWPR